MKPVARAIFSFVYCAVILLSLLMVIKPGASLFYLKQNVDKQTLVPEAGYAYRYKLDINPVIFRTQGILVFEDGIPLTLSDDDTVINTGIRTFSIDEATHGTVYLYLSSSDNSSLISNDHAYKIYIPAGFDSRPNGILLLLVFLPGLAWSLAYALSPGNRKTILQSPNGLVTVWNRFFENPSSTPSTEGGTVTQQLSTRPVVWYRLFTITILAAYFYILMEWLFFITKPSFMSLMGTAEKAEILILSGWVFAVISLLLIVIYMILDVLAVIFNLSGVTRSLAPYMPTFIITTSILLLIDNFTYTIFKFGVSTATGVWRGVYGIVFIILFIYIYRNILRNLDYTKDAKQQNPPYQRLSYLAIGLLVISSGLAIARLDAGRLSSSAATAETGPGAQLPNIILLGSDGVNADNMSVYGYERDTTPRLRELAQTSLVAENDFTNSSNSAGSVVSILTSKLPTQTRVVYAPDILTGINAYQHLPGLLKREGYLTVELGVPDYVDAYSFNLQYSFDSVNGHSQDMGILGAFLRRLGFDNVAYFQTKLTERASDRLQHIFFMRDMQNPYNVVTQPASNVVDEEKVAELLNTIGNANVPVFAHVHLMGTHGAIFEPPVQVFSKDEAQDEEWMVDFYDDAILAFDSYVGEIIDQLKANGEYENTILIIYSDHPMQYRVNKRIPLIFHFPRDEYAGKISQSVQNLDISPTILDYLEIPTPQWMAGRTILNLKPGDNQLIYSAGAVNVEEITKGIFALDPQKIKPPFYQFSFINVLDCQRWYQLDLTTLAWISGDIPNHTKPCSEGDLLSMDDIKQQVKNQLLRDGFDASSLP